MADVVSRFEQAIRKINLIYGLLIPILIGVVMGCILHFLDPDFFKTDHTANLVYLVILVVGVSVLILHLATKGKVSRWAHVLLYVFYCAGLTLLTLFIDPYPTPFYFQYIVLLIAIDLIFGKWWLRFGIVYFAVVFILTYLESTDHVTVEGLALAATYIIGSTSVVILVSRYRKVSDDERKQLESATHQNAFERQRLLSLINNMGEAVFATDEQGKILLYNAATLSLLDTNQTLEGKPVNSILNLHDKSGKKIDVFHKLQQSVTGFTSSDYKHIFSKDDAINVYFNGSPIKLGYKETTQTGFIIIMRDITKEKSLEEERDEFISVVSHELRTPITIAEGNISNAMILGAKKNNKKVIEDSLKQAHDQVLFLANMINDLATLSRAERSDKVVEISEVNPISLLRTLHSDYEVQAQTKGLKLVTHAAPETKPIQTSELYLHEILQNFITNAIKYTKEGSVVLHVRSDTQGNAVFSVADTGIGLSKADQKHVFEKFFRSEDFRTRESSGTGLGLYVTEKIAHKIGATITFESELNKGTTFTVVVPSMKKPS